MMFLSSFEDELMKVAIPLDLGIMAARGEVAHLEGVETPTKQVLDKIEEHEGKKPTKKESPTTMRTVARQISKDEDQHRINDELHITPYYPDTYNKHAMLRERIREGSPLINYFKRGAKKQLAQIRKTAGECKKTLTVDGLTMKFEHLKGDRRFIGKPHERTMHDCYGYMPGTFGKGADGEAIDIYVNPDFQKGSALGTVYKVKQLKKGTGTFDEDKFMVGYDSAFAAKKAFLHNMPSWAFGSMTSMPAKSFRNLVGQTQPRTTK